MVTRNFPSDHSICKKNKTKQKKLKSVKTLDALSSFTNRKERLLNIPDRVLFCVYLFQVEIRRKINVQVSQERKAAVVWRSSPARQRSDSPSPPARHMCARIKNPSLHTVDSVSVKTEIKTAST